MLRLSPEILTAEITEVAATEAAAAATAADAVPVEGSAAAAEQETAVEARSTQEVRMSERGVLWVRLESGSGMPTAGVALSITAGVGRPKRSRDAKGSANPVWREDVGFRGKVRHPLHSPVAAATTATSEQHVTHARPPLARCSRRHACYGLPRARRSPITHSTRRSPRPVVTSPTGGPNAHVCAATLPDEASFSASSPISSRAASPLPPSTRSMRRPPTRLVPPASAWPPCSTSTPRLLSSHCSRVTAAAAPPWDSAAA